jgi:hypothetical protein
VYTTYCWCLLGETSGSRKSLRVSARGQSNPSPAVFGFSPVPKRKRKAQRGQPRGWVVGWRDGGTEGWRDGGTGATTTRGGAEGPAWAITVGLLQDDLFFSFFFSFLFFFRVDDLALGQQQVSGWMTTAGGEKILAQGQEREEGRNKEGCCRRREGGREEEGRETRTGGGGLRERDVLLRASCVSMSRPRVWVHYFAKGNIIMNIFISKTKSKSKGGRGGERERERERTLRPPACLLLSDKKRETAAGERTKKKRRNCDTSSKNNNDNSELLPPAAAAARMRMVSFLQSPGAHSGFCVIFAVYTNCLMP